MAMQMAVHMAVQMAVQMDWLPGDPFAHASKKWVSRCLKTPPNLVLGGLLGRCQGGRPPSCGGLFFSPAAFGSLSTGLTLPSGPVSGYGSVGGLRGGIGVPHSRLLAVI